MSFSLDTDNDEGGANNAIIDSIVVTNFPVVNEEDVLSPPTYEVIVSNEELLENLMSAIERVNDEKNRLLLGLYYDLQLQTGVRKASTMISQRRNEWVGVTTENQLVFSGGVQMLIYEGLDRAVFNRMYYPYTMGGSKQPPPPLDEEFPDLSDEDRVNHVILKWREFSTNGSDFLIPLTTKYN